MKMKVTWISLSWELNDHVKLITMVASFFVLSTVLTSTLLNFHAVGFGGGSLPILRKLHAPVSHASTVRSMDLLTLSATAILSLPNFAVGFWILLSFIIPVLVIMTFRYPRDYGYAQSIHTLPLGKSSIFGVKTLSLYIFSLLLTIVPIMTVQAVCYADLPGLLKATFESSMYLHSLITEVYFMNYLLALSILLSLLLRNSFLTFIVSFFATTMPYFAQVPFSVPPFMFVMNSVTQNPISFKYLSLGIGLPALLLFLSWLLFTRRDVL